MPISEISGVKHRPEHELLVACARNSASLKNTERIRELLKEKIDWSYVIQCAQRHRILPLLYRSLSGMAPEGVPEIILNNLRNRFNSNGRRNLYLTGELLKLLGFLAENGISAIPFKGPVLALSAYGDLSLRQFDDLDILIPKSDVLKAKELLVSRNYRLRDPFTPERAEACLRIGCEFVFERQDGMVTVDLHWDFAETGFGFRFDLEKLWHRLEPISIGGRKVHTLPIEDTLLLHCVHGSKHEWERLEWICALSELIRTHRQIDWDRVFEKASSLSSERMFLVGLRLTRDLLETDLPGAALEKLKKDPVLDSLVSQVCKGLFSEEEAYLKEATRYAFHLKMREKWTDKARYFFNVACRKLTPNARDQKQLPLPAFLSFTYVLTRPIRLLREYGVSPLIQFLKRLRSI